MSKKISTERKSLYYTGLSITIMGVLMFFSSFFLIGQPEFTKRITIAVIFLVVGFVLTRLAAGSSGKKEVEEYVREEIDQEIKEVAKETVKEGRKEEIVKAEEKAKDLEESVTDDLVADLNAETEQIQVEFPPTYSITKDMPDVPLVESDWIRRVYPIQEEELDTGEETEYQL